MKSFEYASPKTVKDATALLGDKWGETEILAGGTDLITSMKQGLVEPKRVVSLKNIPDLRGIKTDGGNLRTSLQGDGRAGVFLGGVQLHPEDGDGVLQCPGRR